MKGDCDEVFGAQLKVKLGLQFGPTDSLQGRADIDFVVHGDDHLRLLQQRVGDGKRLANILHSQMTTCMHIDGNINTQYTMICN